MIAKSVGVRVCVLTLYISGRIVAPKFKGINYNPTWVCAYCPLEATERRAEVTAYHKSKRKSKVLMHVM